MNALLDILKTHWGYDDFRPMQREAMALATARRDSLVVLPTGGGKSLCYQVPALAMDGMALVVSPLIALMKDQVDALRECGVAAAAIHSMLGVGEKREIDADLRAGRLKLLYVSPERLAQPRFIEYLRGMGISFIAIDEAHCISMWGHDFRPEYRALRHLKETFPGVAVHAYTATATPQVRDDIVAQLGLDRPEVLVGSFNRPNLNYAVQRAADRVAQIAEIAARHPGESGIVYCISRKDTEATAAALCRLGLRARAYHAGLPDQERHACQDAFARDEVDVVVATVAFGMGIDKSNVRFVVHAGMPKSIEHYQQESGRAGRDGLEAECVLLYTKGDFMLWRRIIEKDGAESEGARVALDKLRDVDRYATGIACRRKFLLGYFAEDFAESNCQACDVCLDTVDLARDAADIARKILGAIRDTAGRFGGGYVLKVLRGEADERVQGYGHDKAGSFGALRDQPAAAVRQWMDQLEGQGLVERVGDYGLLQVTDEGQALLADPHAAAPRLSEATRGAKRRRVSRAEAESWSGVERGLYDSLRQLRRELAEAKGVPAYVILGDATLRDLARVRPSQPNTLLHVRGIGHRKAEAYGAPLLEAIARYCAMNSLERDIGVDPDAGAAAPPRRERPRHDDPEAGEGRPARASRSETRDRAFAAFAQGKRMEEVVEETGRAASTLHGYLVDYLKEHGITDPEPWVDADTHARITAAAGAVGGERLKPVFEFLQGEVDYDTIRLSMTCHRNRRAPGGLAPKPDVPPASSPPPPSPPATPSARAESPEERAARERLAAGEAPAAVAEALGQTEAWACDVLARHLRATGATSPFPWIEKMTYLQVASAAAQADSFDLDRVVQATGNTIPRHHAQIALVCLRNRQG
jgi:ATP-dependent DNA helicase RecQ